MKNGAFRKAAIAGMIAVALVLQGCGEDPAELLASARKAIESRDFNTATIHVKNVLQKDASNVEARKLFGEVLLAQGNAADAERELRKAMEAGSQNEQVIPLLAWALFESGQPKKVTDEFAGKTMETVEGRTALLTTLGRSYLAQSDTAKAQAQIDLAAKESPEDSRVLYGQALLLLAQRNEAGATELLERILKKDPAAVEPLLLKGDILAASGKFDEAIVQVAKARDLKPELRLAIGAQTRLLGMYLQQQKLDEVAAALTLLKQLAPKSPQTFYWEARLALARKEPAKARDAIAQVLRAAPDHVPSVILAAMADMALGDQLPAQTRLESVIAKYQGMVGARKLLTQSYLSSRNATKALETITPLLTPENRDSAVMGMAGQAYLLAGDIKKSQEYFEKQVKFEPNSAIARTRLGLTRLAVQDDEHAMQDLEAAIKLDPSSIQADMLIIATHVRKKDLAKALVAAEALEKKQPENPLVWNIKGSVMLAAKDVSGARTAFSRAIALQPGNLAAATQLARLDVAEKKIDAARKHYEDILAKEPKNSSAYLLLAQLGSETGMDAAAVRGVLERGIKAAPADTKLRVALVRLLTQQQDLKGALERAQQAQTALPDSPEILRALGAAQLASNQAQQAITTFSKLQALDSANPSSLILLAQAQVAAGETSSAEQSLRSAIRLKPDFIPAYEGLVAELVREQRFDEALKVARDLKQRKPDNAGGLVLEARALGSQKRWPEAAGAWQQVVQKFKLPQGVIGTYSAQMAQNKESDAKKTVGDWIRNNPKDQVVRSFLAERAIAAKDYREAQVQYATLLTLEPNSAIAHNNYAWALHQLNNSQAAQEHAETALKLSPQSPAILDTLGTILVDRGQTAKGLETLKRAVDLAPKAAELRLSYAKALSKTGDKNGARKEVAKAVELAPEKSPIRSEAEQLTKSL